MNRRPDEVRPGPTERDPAPSLGRDTPGGMAATGVTSASRSDEYRRPKVVSYPSKRLLEMLGAAQG